jgi:dephospho-CoA kinase
MSINFKEDYPIVIGFAGKAGSGKTSVAEYLVPKGSIETTLYGMKWDHIFYALPLYEMASIKRSIRGFNQESRQLYAIHDTLYDIYGRSPIGTIPDYETFVSKVKEIHNLSIEEEGIKPRSFLQKSGDICREGYADCFSDWAITKSTKLYNSYRKNLNEEDDELPFVVFISDVRFVNEAQKILNQPNGIVICFDANEDTLNDRILKRDGKLMSSDQKNHISEQQIDTIKSMASLIIPTDDMTIEQQAQATLKALGILKEANA